MSHLKSECGLGQDLAYQVSNIDFDRKWCADLGVDQLKLQDLTWQLKVLKGKHYLAVVELDHKHQSLLCRLETARQRESSSQTLADVQMIESLATSVEDAKRHFTLLHATHKLQAVEVESQIANLQRKLRLAITSNI